MVSAMHKPDAGRTGPEDRRSSFRDLMGLAGPLARVGHVEDRAIPAPDRAIPIRLYTPLASRAGLLSGLVFFHGGGMVAGDLFTHDGLCRRLCNATGHRVIAVDYRLAPEHKFPAATIDADVACAWVLENAWQLDLDPSRIGVAGDSAGAALAIRACLGARAAGRPMPVLQLLLCPITDFAAATGSRKTFAQGYLIDEPMIAQDLECYLPSGLSPADPRVSPLRAPTLEGLPPAFVHVAECDPFRDEGLAYAERLRHAGVAVSTTCHGGMVHLFYALFGVLPDAAEAAFAQIGAEIGGYLGAA
jgi:acetyl esterase/lipase